MKQGTFTFRGRGVQAIIGMIALLGLLSVPVECATVHGPHSIFSSPSALAMLSEPAPHADQHPATATTHHERHETRHRSFHFSPRHEDEHQSEPTPMAPEAGPLPPTSGDEPPAASAPGPSTPRVLSMAAMSSAPVVPAVLDSVDPMLPPIPTIDRAWLELTFPRGRSLPGPEPPPP
jgi:hypothetical protein